MFKKKLTLLATFIILACLLPHVSKSQNNTSPSSNTSEEGITIYNAEFFEPYRPSHAKDMLERIPGATAALNNRYDISGEESNRRGLRSQTTQILINSKRITTKGNSLQEYFERIPSSQVKRIEVIAGNVREIDADAGSRVINVVLKDQSSIGGTWNIGNVSFTDQQHMPTASASISGEPGKWSYTLFGQTRPFQIPRKLEEVFLDTSDTPFIRKNEKRRIESRNYVGRGRLAYSISETEQLQLSGFVSKRPINLVRDFEYIYDLDSNRDSTLTGTNFDDRSGDDFNYEISGDYSFEFYEGISFKAFFVYNIYKADRENLNFDFDPSAETTQLFIKDKIIELDNDEILRGESQLLSKDTLDKKETEKIIRATFDWRINPRHTIELGAEGAINTLDKTRNFFDIVDSQEIERDVFNADQIVTEDRTEVFTTYAWKPIDIIEIESGVALEASWLKQIGSDVDTERSLKFIKPSLDFYFTASKSTQIVASFRRDIGQLEFDDFVADLDREDNEIDAGNPDLKPEKSWNGELAIEQRLFNQSGVLNLRGFYRSVQDVKDNIPLGINDSGPGNLGSGTHYGGEAEISLQLSQLGLIDAVISGSVLWQDSSVKDPFTLKSRRFADQEKYRIDIDTRHDLKELGISYGIFLNKPGPKITSDYNTFERETTGWTARVFFEKRFNNGIVGRLFWGNMFRANIKRTKSVYIVSQAQGDILQTELRSQKLGGFYGFSVRGIF